MSTTIDGATSAVAPEPDLLSLVTALQQRVRELEDVAEIQRLVATYGPAADGTNSDAFVDQWTEDGVYDIDVGVWRGHDELRKMSHTHWHEFHMQYGAAHLASPPRITLDGDRAVVTNYLQLIRHTGFGGFSLVRLSAHRWDLVRTDRGWRVSYRKSRQLNGSPDAYEILASDM